MNEFILQALAPGTKVAVPPWTTVANLGFVSDLEAKCFELGIPKPKEPADGLTSPWYDKYGSLTQVVYFYKDTADIASNHLIIAHEEVHVVSFLYEEFKRLINYNDTFIFPRHYQIIECLVLVKALVERAVERATNQSVPINILPEESLADLAAYGAMLLNGFSEREVEKVARPSIILSRRSSIFDGELFSAKELPGFNLLEAIGNIITVKGESQPLITCDYPSVFPLKLYSADGLKKENGDPIVNFSQLSTGHFLLYGPAEEYQAVKTTLDRLGKSYQADLPSPGWAYLILIDPAVNS